MWESGRPSVKWNEIYRLLPALMGLLGIFLLELLTSLGIAVRIGYAFPLWYVSRFSLKPAVSLRLVSLACTGLIIAGYFLSPPGMNEFYPAGNQTMGVIFLWAFTLRLMWSGAVDDEWLNKAQENLQYSETQFRVMAHEALLSGPRRQTYSSNLLRKQGTL